MPLKPERPLKDYVPSRQWRTHEPNLDAAKSVLTSPTFLSMLRTVQEESPLRRSAIPGNVNPTEAANLAMMEVGYNDALNKILALGVPAAIHDDPLGRNVPETFPNPLEEMLEEEESDDEEFVE